MQKGTMWFDMNTCDKCIHKKVCVIKAFPDIFENTEWGKKPCDHFEVTEEYGSSLQTVLKKAQWEKVSDFMPIYGCSVCGERNLFKNGNNVLSNYCPNCGAKMKGKGGEG